MDYEEKAKQIDIKREIMQEAYLQQEMNLWPKF